MGPRRSGHGFIDGVAEYFCAELIEERGEIEGADFFVSAGEKERHRQKLIPGERERERRQRRIRHTKKEKSSRLVVGIL